MPPTPVNIDSDDPTNACFEKHWPRFFEQWKTLVRFPSISADPDYQSDCRQCAQWLHDHLGTMGFDSQRIDTVSHPIVLARRPGAADCPSVLFYGHYDVQPVAPESAWETPPFEPALRNGRLYGRGTQDNKGQLFAVIKAIEMLHRQQVPLPPITILLEGDEENGRSVLESQLDEWRDRLKADVLMVSDTDMADADRPALIMGLRGIIHMTVTVSGLLHDLHSGLHGGVAPNPAVGMARLLATLHDADGRIAIENFEKDVIAPNVGEQRLVRERPGFGPDYRRRTGVDPVGGAPGIDPAERLGFHPCIDVNGILSGHTGEGSKTIIPATAMAKITARLAAGQYPETALRRLTAHLRRHTPKGLTVTVADAHVGGPALRVPLQAPAIATARETLRDMFGVEPLGMWEGASIPVLARLAEVSGATPVLVGFGLPADRVHAPNESFRIDGFRDGFRFATRFLTTLAKTQ